MEEGWATHGEQKWAGRWRGPGLTIFCQEGAGHPQHILSCILPPKNFKPNLMIEIEEKHSKNDLNNSISYICSLGYRVFCLKNKELTPLENIENIKQFNNFIFRPI